MPALEIVRHRINDLDALAQLDPSYGAEIDIRSFQRELILAHEPHHTGPLLKDFLEIYARRHSQRLLILNPKEDGVEKEIASFLLTHRIERFFFLDLTLPAAVRMVFKDKERRVAVRVSEYEPSESARLFAGHAEWLWVDCFKGVPANPNAWKDLRAHFKICVVSPELQGYPKETIASFKSAYESLQPDAVCTKFPKEWE